MFFGALWSIIGSFRGLWRGLAASRAFRWPQIRGCDRPHFYGLQTPGLMVDGAGRRQAEAYIDPTMTEHLANSDENAPLMFSLLVRYDMLLERFS